MQMGLSSQGTPSQPHPSNPQQQQQQQQMQQMYPFYAQQQQAGSQMQQLLNNAGSGVSAGAGAPGGPQPNTLAMAQQQQLNGANQLNYVPPATRPGQASNLFSQGQRGFYPPAIAAQVCEFVPFVNQFFTPRRVHYCSLYCSDLTRTFLSNLNSILLLPRAHTFSQHFESGF